MISINPSSESLEFMPVEVRSASICHIIIIYSQFVTKHATYLRSFALFARWSTEALRPVCIGVASLARSPYVSPRMGA